MKKPIKKIIKLPRKVFRKIKKHKWASALVAAPLILHAITGNWLQAGMLAVSMLLAYVSIFGTKNMLMDVTHANSGREWQANFYSVSALTIMMNVVVAIALLAVITNGTLIAVPADVLVCIWSVAGGALACASAIGIILGIHGHRLRRAVRNSWKEREKHGFAQSTCVPVAD